MDRGDMPLGCEHCFLLHSAVGAACYPEGAAGRVLPAQGVTELGYVGRQLDVELEISRDVRAFRSRPEGAEALGVSFALCRDHHTPRDGLPEERTETPVAIDRAARQPRTGDDQRYAAEPALAIKVRPELRLDDDRKARTRAIEEAAHGSGKVERQKAHLCYPAEQRAGACGSRGSECGHQHRGLRI